MIKAMHRAEQSMHRRSDEKCDNIKKRRIWFLRLWLCRGCRAKWKIGYFWVDTTRWGGWRQPPSPFVCRVFWGTLKVAISPQREIEIPPRSLRVFAYNSHVQLLKLKLHKTHFQFVGVINEGVFCTLPETFFFFSTNEKGLPSLFFFEQHFSQWEWARKHLWNHLDELLIKMSGPFFIW